MLAHTFIFRVAPRPTVTMYESKMRLALPWPTDRANLTCLSSIVQMMILSSTTYRWPLQLWDSRIVTAMTWISKVERARSPQVSIIINICCLSFVVQKTVNWAMNVMNRGAESRLCASGFTRKWICPVLKDSSTLLTFYLNFQMYLSAVGSKGTAVAWASVRVALNSIHFGLNK